MTKVKVVYKAVNRGNIYVNDLGLGLKVRGLRLGFTVRV